MDTLGVRGIRAVVGSDKAPARIHVAHEDLLLSGKTIRGVMGSGGTAPDSHLALLRLRAQGRFSLKRQVRRHPFAAVNQAIDDIDAGTVVRPILVTEPGAA